MKVREARVKFPGDNKTWERLMYPCLPSRTRYLRSNLLEATRD